MKYTWYLIVIAEIARGWWMALCKQIFATYEVLRHWDKYIMRYLWFSIYRSIPEVLHQLWKSDLRFLHNKAAFIRWWSFIYSSQRCQWLPPYSTISTIVWESRRYYSSSSTYTAGSTKEGALSNEPRGWSVSDEPGPFKLITNGRPTTRGHHCRP